MHHARAPIALAPRRFKGDPTCAGSWSCAYLFFENALGRSLADAGALVVGTALPDPGGAARAAQDYASLCNGLVLQGGTDIDPALSDAVGYSEPDTDRDTFELALIRAFADAGKPILGLCRGMQLINIAFGGTLATLTNHNAAHHSNPARYVEHGHLVELVGSGFLASLYRVAGGHVNSAHRQVVSRLGMGFVVEATDPSDGRIEAIFSTRHDFVLGVQWHPEFLRADGRCLDGDLLIRDFVSRLPRFRH